MLGQVLDKRVQGRRGGCVAGAHRVGDGLGLDGDEVLHLIR